MDHFNLTVQNGTLVSTRRGLQVSKTKHQGTRFVNSFASTPPQSTDSRQSGVTVVDFTKPLQARFKFVAARDGKVVNKPGKGRGKSKSKSPSPPLDAKAKDDEAARGQSKKVVFRRGTASIPSDASSTALAITKAWAGGGPSALGTGFRPKIWRTHSGFNHLSFDVSDKARQLIHVYFNVVPNKMYPLEEILDFNPVRTHSFFERVHGDLVTMHCVVMAAALVEAVGRGERYSDELTFYLGRVCNMVNGRLQHGTQGIEPSVLDSVVAMATCSTIVGRHDHWHLHMKGLKRIIEMSGGLKKEHPYTLNKCRRGDVKGAAIIGALPYLEYPRFRDLISNRIEPETRLAITDEVQALLEPCGINPLIVDAMTSLAKFSRIVAMARNDPDHSIKFDPEAFVEEWYWVEYKLVKYPGPLRDEAASPLDTIGVVDTTVHPAVAANAAAAPLRVDPGPRPSYVDSRYSPLPRLVPTFSANLLEPAVRLAAVLYIEESVPDVPRSLNAYAVLLGLLHYQVGAVLAALRARLAAGTLAEDGAVAALRPDGLPGLAALRPPMVWVCLVGYYISLVADKHETAWGSEARDRGVFRECLALLVGARPELAGRLPAADLAACRLFDLGEFKLNGWEDRRALEVVLREHVMGEAAVRPLLMEFMYDRAATSLW